MSDKLTAEPQIENLRAWMNGHTLTLPQAADAIREFVMLCDYTASLQSELSKVIEERDKLKAFKEYVHKRLDDAGIEKEPDGKHSKNGCRIGDRLDIVESWIEMCGIQEKAAEGLREDIRKINKRISNAYKLLDKELPIKDAYPILQNLLTYNLKSDLGGSDPDKTLVE